MTHNHGTTYKANHTPGHAGYDVVSLLKECCVSLLEETYARLYLQLFCFRH